MAHVVTTADLPSSHRDLLEAAGVGVLATIGPGGRPHVSAVWYLLDDDGFLKLTMRTDRQKIRNLRLRPLATFFIVDPRVSTRTLEVRAVADLAPDDDYAFADRIGQKYGADLRTFDEPRHSRIVVTLRPLRVNRRD